MFLSRVSKRVIHRISPARFSTATETKISVSSHSHSPPGTSYHYHNCHYRYHYPCLCFHVHQLTGYCRIYWPFLCKPLMWRWRTLRVGVDPCTTLQWRALYSRYTYCIAKNLLYCWRELIPCFPYTPHRGSPGWGSTSSWPVPWRQRSKKCMAWPLRPQYPCECLWMKGAILTGAAAACYYAHTGCEMYDKDRQQPGVWTDSENR